MKKAPYDERNAADYVDMSNRIELALRKLDTSPELPATEDKLAELAGCGRGTLRNRKYPLIELKIIKDKRKQQKQKLKSSAKSKNVGESKDADLERQLKQSSNEIGVWVNKYQDLEAENKKLLRINKLLKDEILTLRSQNESLIKQINDLQKTTKVKENKQNVFYLKNSKS